MRIVPLLCAVALVLLLASCQHYTPRWTPDNVSQGPFTPPEDQRQPIEQRAEEVKGTPATPENDQTIPITKDAAVLTAFLNNLGIQVANFGPKISQTFVPEARAAFDPELTAAIAAGHNATLAGSGLAGSNLSGLNSGLAGTDTGTGTGTVPITGGTGLPGAETTLNNLVSTITSVQTLLNTLNPPRVGITRTNNVNGTISLTELLPTGTQLSFDGTGATTSSNSAGDTNSGTWDISVAQPLLRGAGRDVNLVVLRQAKNTAAQSAYQFKQTVLDISRQVELQYWNIVLDNEVLKIRDFAVNLAQEQLQHEQAWLDVGKAIQADVSLAEAETATRQADLEQARGDLRTATIEMLRLMNPGDARQWSLTLQPMALPDVVEVPLDPYESEKIALAYRPEIPQQRLNIANADLGVVASKNNLLPKLDAVASLGQTSEGLHHSEIISNFGDSRLNNYSVGINLQTPLLFRAEKARYERAELTQSQQEKTLANTEQTIGAQVHQAVVNAQTQWHRLTATKKAVEARNAEYETQRGRMDVGKITNLDLLIIQRDLIQAQLDDVTARIQYIQALTSLYAAEGTLLERQGIALDLPNAVQD